MTSQQKCQALKAFKAGNCKQASCETAKRIARPVVHHMHAHYEADKVVYKRIDHNSFNVIHLTSQMRNEIVNAVGDKPVKNNAWEISMCEEVKQNVCADHYKKLINVEFDWDLEHLSNKAPREGQPTPITINMMKKAISKMKWPIRHSRQQVIQIDATMIRDLATIIIQNGKVSTLEIPGRKSKQMTLSSLLSHWRNVLGGS